MLLFQQPQGRNGRARCNWPGPARVLCLTGLFDSDICLVAWRLLMSNSKPAHTHTTCMAIPRKPVQNYWQTLVRCDFQLNPLPPVSKASEWPGRTSGRLVESQATKPPCDTDIGQSFFPTQGTHSRAGLGIPDHSALWIPSIEMSEAFPRLL